MLAGGQWKVKTQSGTSSFRNNYDNNDNNTKTGRNKNRVKMSIHRIKILIEFFWIETTSFGTTKSICTFSWSAHGDNFLQKNKIKQLFDISDGVLYNGELLAPGTIELIESSTLFTC